MDKKISFKLRFEYIIDRCCDNFNRTQRYSLHRNAYNHFLHIMTCPLYPEYIDETTGLLCNKLKRKKCVVNGVGGIYNYIYDLKCMCGYRFVDIDIDTPAWDQTLVQYLGEKLLSVYGF